jgi:RHS repeat-associated protein
MKYDAFGKITWLDNNFSAKNSSDFNWNRTFTGQALDAETGLMLYRNRFYHTGLGRFFNRDPIGYQGKDTSLYRYLRNRVTNLNDSFGLAPPWEMPQGPIYGPNMPTTVPQSPTTSWPTPTPHGCTLMADGSVKCGPPPNIPIPPTSNPSVDDEGGIGCSNSPIFPTQPSLSTRKSNVQKCCRTTRVCMCIDALSYCFNLKHCWIKTTTQSGGMGPAGGGKLPLSPWYGTETETRDHSGESSVDCQTIYGCDEDCINKAIAPGQSTGTWSSKNNCNTFVDKVLARCCGNTGR